MKVDLKEFEKHMSYFRKLNNSNIEDWEIIDDEGNKIEVAEGAIEDFKFTGLSNKDFLRFRIWENTIEDII